MTENKTGIKTSLVRELAELLVDLDLNEIDVKNQEIRIRLSRGIKGGAMVSAAPVVHTPAALVDAPQVVASETKSNNKNAIPSPMVGTIYLAASPDADPYVSVGSTVHEGDTLLIIEAMKTMNHISAPKSGTVTAILVEDKQPVEFGEALVIIE